MKLLIYSLLILLLPAWNPATVRAEYQNALEQILALAYHRDPRIAAKRLELSAAEEGVTQAWGGYFPHIQGVGEYGSFHYEDPLQRDGKRRTIGLEASQLLFDFGRVGGRIDQAKKLVEKLEWGLESLAQGIALETINAYLAYHEAVDILRLHEQNVANLAEQLLAVKEEVEAGMNVITNLALVDSRYDLATARFEQAQTKVYQARIALERMTGPLPDELLDAPPDDPDHLYSVPDSLNGALVQSAKNFPEIQTAKADVSVAQAFQKQTKAELYPAVHLKGFYQTGSFGESDAEADSAQVVMQMPLYQGGVNWSKLREAKTIVSQKRKLVSATEERLQEEVKVVWSEILSLVKAEKIWQHSMNLEYKALDGIKEQVKYEIVTMRDLLRAQEDIVQKEMEFKKITYQKLVAQFRLVQLSSGKSLTRSLD